MLILFKQIVLHILALCMSLSAATANANATALVFINFVHWCEVLVAVSNDMGRQ